MSIRTPTKFRTAALSANRDQCRRVQWCSCAVEDKARLPVWATLISKAFEPNHPDKRCARNNNAQDDGCYEPAVPFWFFIGLCVQGTHLPSLPDRCAGLQGRRSRKRQKSHPGALADVVRDGEVHPAGRSLVAAGAVRRAVGLAQPRGAESAADEGHGPAIQPDIVVLHVVPDIATGFAHAVAVDGAGDVMLPRGGAFIGRCSVRMGPGSAGPQRHPLATRCR